MLKTVVMIPARMQATRLPGKPLANIAGRPMIVHVWQRGVEAGLGPVVVATDAAEIAQAVEAAGGAAIMTRDDHISGSDRIFEALGKFDPEGNFEAIVNLQGDLPCIEPSLIRRCAGALHNQGAEIATLAAVITDPSELLDPNVVKVIGTPTGAQGASNLRALYFTRAAAPSGHGPFLHHIGLYAYRRDALRRFVSLPPGVLEMRERLEQLRALEAGMRIDAAVVDTVPLGVDTPADLEKARAILAALPQKTMQKTNGENRLAL
jgi:3-deoxy-manno-octulosonate cytidylyltransferase (CMP-KDO synthetase)